MSKIPIHVGNFVTIPECEVCGNILVNGECPQLLEAISRSSMIKSVPQGGSAWVRYQHDVEIMNRHNHPEEYEE